MAMSRPETHDLGFVSFLFFGDLLDLDKPPFKVPINGSTKSYPEVPFFALTVLTNAHTTAPT